MPIKTIKIAISSIETVTKGPFNNYVKVLWIDWGGGRLTFVTKRYNNKVGRGFIIIICKSNSNAYVFYTLHFPMVY